MYVIVTEKMKKLSGLSLLEKLQKLKENSMKKSDVMDDMRKEYDFSNAKKNPYACKLKKQITINLDERVLAYFKEEAEQSGIPYQSLINLYLLNCVKEKRKLNISWE